MFHASALQDHRLSPMWPKTKKDRRLAEDVFFLAATRMFKTTSTVVAVRRSRRSRIQSSQQTPT